MIKLQRIHNNQFTFFNLSLIIFLIATAFGWERLHYGFSFVDEGYYMTEAWRLSVGDALFQDKIRGAIEFSSIINSICFTLYPDITLLEFREIQLSDNQIVKLEIECVELH